MKRPFGTFLGWCSGTAHNKRNELRVAALIILWSLSSVLVKLGIGKEVLADGGPLLAAVAASALLGLGTVWAYLRFLGGLDELRRKIELDALALAFGVGLVMVFTASLLGDAGIMPWDDLMSFLFALMLVTYSIGSIRGYLRYS